MKSSDAHGSLRLSRESLLYDDLGQLPVAEQTLHGHYKAPIPGEVVDYGEDEDISRTDVAVNDIALFTCFLVS